MAQAVADNAAQECTDMHWQRAKMIKAYERCSGPVLFEPQSSISSTNSSPLLFSMPRKMRQKKRQQATYDTQRATPHLSCAAKAGKCTDPALPSAAEQRRKLSFTEAPTLELSLSRTCTLLQICKPA